MATLRDALKIIAEHMAYNFSKDHVYQPDDDTWLKNELRSNILSGICQKAGFRNGRADATCLGCADGGLGHNDVSPERMQRILDELSQEPIMAGIKIKVKTTRCISFDSFTPGGRAETFVTWKAIMEANDEDASATTEDEA